MKPLSRVVFAAYLLALAWLVLFKLSFDLTAVFAPHRRTINLVPFQSSVRETIYNLVAFIPYGLLLCVNVKRANPRRKLALIFGSSLAVEVLQFLGAIGISDITDVITNTLGGLLGLLLYAVGEHYAGADKVDRFIVITGTVVLVVFALFLGLLFSRNIRFQAAR